MLNLRRINGLQINSVGERLLQNHLAAERFQAGVLRQLWRLVQVEWPHAVFAIGSTPGTSTREVGLRLKLEKYPVAPPLVQLWDLAALCAIDAPHWPEPFIRFASKSYPELIDLDAGPCCPALLRISVHVARQGRHPTRPRLFKGDVTQLLVQVSECFRCPERKRLQLPSRCAGGLDKDRITFTTHP